MWKTGEKEIISIRFLKNIIVQTNWQCPQKVLNSLIVATKAIYKVYYFSRIVDFFYNVIQKGHYLQALKRSFFAKIKKKTF